MAIAKKTGLIYGLDGQLIGSVGSAGQVRQGHLLTTKSFPPVALDSTKLSIFGMDNTPNDEYGGRNLTANGSPAGTTGIFGSSNEALALVAASSQYLSSTDAFFDPGNVNFCCGGWFYSADWVPASNQGLFGQGDTSSDRVFYVALMAAGTLFLSASVGGTTQDIAQGFPHGISDGTAGWHHVALRYTSTGNTLDLFLDGKPLASMPLGGSFRSATTNRFQIGALNGATFFDGKVDEFFFVNGVALTDHDIAILASTRLDHNAGLDAAKQRWEFTHFPAGVADAANNAGDLILKKGDTNSAFVDFSNLDPTDKISVRLTEIGG